MNYFLKPKFQLGVVAGTFDPGGWAGAPGQSGLHSKTLRPKYVSTKSPTVLVINTILSY